MVARKRAVKKKEDSAENPIDIPVEKESKELVSCANKDAKAVANSYMTSQGDKDLVLLSSGCTLLDLTHGGGYPLGRMVNIVGDKSAGKSLLCIEALANFRLLAKEKNWKTAMWYNEAESAFDQAYAQALGMPIQDIYFVSTDNEPKETRVDDANGTIEGLYDNLKNVCDYHEANKLDGGIYIIDSMDALSDREEMGREIDKGSYGANKPKKIGELFRRLVRKLEQQNILFIIVSQVRDKIGVTFGETKTRSGGKALDFYASLITWLADIGKVTTTVQGITRPVGVNIRAKCKKNKVGLPFRDCDYYLEFGYGVDDFSSNVNFLESIKDDEWLEENLSVKKTTKKRRLNTIKNSDDYDEFMRLSSITKQRVIAKWCEIEQGFLSKRSKYGG